jgi:phospholipid/cholesterol/gamma-HCH transport system substrate-binding protein
METRANFVLIGAFTLAVIAGAFLFVLWFSGLTRISEHKSYEILFTGSVSGLSRGGAVLFNGLRVGEVTDINLVPNDPSRMQALVDVAGNVPIKQDTKARLEIQGLTGGALIALSGGAPDAPSLVEKNGAPPIIVAEPSELQDIMENVRSLSAKAESVLAKADKLIGDNSVAVGDAIANVDAFSKALSENSSGVNSALAGLSDLGRKIGPLADRLQGVSDDVDKLVVAVDPEKVRRVVTNIDAFAGALADKKASIDSLLSDSAELAKRLNGTSTKLDSALADFDALVKSVDTQKVANLVDRLQVVSGEVDKLIEAVDADKVRRIVTNVDTFAGALADNKAEIDSLLSDSAALAKRLNGTSAQLDSALADFDALVKSVDGRKVASFLDGADSLGQTLRDNKGEIDRMLKNASELAAKLDQSADKIDPLMTSLQGLVGSAEIKGPLGEVGEAARSVRQLADDLNARTKEIAVGLTRFSSSGLREYEALAVDGRRTINDLDRVLRGFERNPSEIIFGAKPNLPEYHGGP